MFGFPESVFPPVLRKMANHWNVKKIDILTEYEIMNLESFSLNE